LAPKIFFLVAAAIFSAALAMRPPYPNWTGSPDQEVFNVAATARPQGVDAVTLGDERQPELPQVLVGQLRKSVRRNLAVPERLRVRSRPGCAARPRFQTVSPRKRSLPG
jgi:hypothetical protein